MPSSPPPKREAVARDVVAGPVTAGPVALRQPLRPLAPRLPSPERSRAKHRRRGLARTVGLYVSGEILGTLGVALLVILLVYLVVIAFQLVRDGIRPSFVLPHLVRTLPYPLFFALPLSFLLGVTLGGGRLSSDRELDALRVTGLSYGELFAPIVTLGLVFAGVNYALTSWVLPGVHYEHANLRETIVDQLTHLGSGSNRSVLLPGSVGLWVGKYDGTSLRKIKLDVPPLGRSSILPRLGDLPGAGALGRRLAGGTDTMTLFAREGELEVAPDRSRITLSLRGVTLLLPEDVKGSGGLELFHQRVSIDKIVLPLAFPRRGESVKDLTSAELGDHIASLDQEIAALRGAISEGASPLAATVARLEEDGDEGDPGAPVQASATKSSASTPAIAAASASGSIASERALATLEKKRSRAAVELTSREVFVCASLTFPLVAYALVLLLQGRGRFTLFFLGNIVVVALFFPLLMVGQSLAYRGWPAVTMHLPTLALGGLFLGLLRPLRRR